MAAVVDARVKKPAPFGKYYLLERINVGGMAEVFRAKAFGVEGFERLVAVKRILPNIAEDKEFIRMFIEEAKLSVQLNHANIAQIFDLGVVESSYYIALEHVHGRDLRGIFDRCRQVGEPMPVAQACFVVMKVCEGLDYAHNKRDQSGRELTLVHRDVSPQNVLVSFEGEVKIIDFGIAKAAGKGSKTQAGILKGKFGYMSPEQVRGLPVDRRSDVFSCGIVLYELLTGERLFVGESDFSTLEKVRNVEILPPSTYNRRIPDELERIVLKALAKDVEDRYQNAIDLHDELQAFVYTAGEFYSRKDLAGWMKKTFGKEIEEETAKLESYRQLKPPPADMPRAATASKPPLTPPRKSTQAMSAVGTKPPPPPTRMSQQMPVVAPPVSTKARNEDSGDLAWDDDELETQIYDNPEDDPRNGGPGKPRTSKPLPTADDSGARAASGRLPLTAPPASQPGIAAASAVTAIEPGGPDLSSLAPSVSRGWDGNSSPPPGARAQGYTDPSPASTLNGIGNGAPAKFPTGSNKTVSPMEIPSLPQANGAPRMFDSGPAPAFPVAARISGGYSEGGDQPFDPMGRFGQNVPQRKSNKGLMIAAIGAAAVAAIAVVLVIALSGGGEESGGGKTAQQPTGSNQPEKGPDKVVTPPSGPADQNTGFDLYVEPSGLQVSLWKLDGESRTDRLPSRIRGIAAGVHTVQIDPPPGFMSASQQVTVEAGKAGRVSIPLQPIPGIVGVFESTPPGARVSLIVDGERQKPLGDAPQKAPLDPRKTYQVLFEKDGYISVNRPIVFTGSLEEKFIVPLEKAGVAVADPKVIKKITPDPKIKPDPKIVKDDPKIVKDDPKVVKDDPKVVKDDPKVIPDPPKKQNGTLVLGSKPPCEIYVDGVATGLHTPQPRMSLPVGKHRITLINNEFGINEKFTVDIKADEPTKMIKDYSDRLPK